MHHLNLAISILFLVILALLTACNKENTDSIRKAESATMSAIKQTININNLNNGQTIYEKCCAYCHSTGTLNATKLGDKDAWAKQVSQGLEHMVNNAIFGIGKMPPRGGNYKLSDYEIKLAVEYIFIQSQ